jgi:hypothetical protein
LIASELKVNTEVNKFLKSATSFIINNLKVNIIVNVKSVKDFPAFGKNNFFSKLAGPGWTYLDLPGLGLTGEIENSFSSMP